MCFNDGNLGDLGPCPVPVTLVFDPSLVVRFPRDGTGLRCRPRSVGPSDRWRRGDGAARSWTAARPPAPTPWARGGGPRVPGVVTVRDNGGPSWRRPNGDHCARSALQTGPALRRWRWGSVEAIWA